MRNRFVRYLIASFALMSFVTAVHAQSRFGQEALEATANATAAELAEVAHVREAKGAQGEATYIVQLAEQPLANYTGGVAGLVATNPASRGQTKLDAQSAESVAYLDYLAQRQEIVIAEASAVLGRDLDVSYTYRASLNGFAASMTPDEAARLSQMPAVQAVERERIFELHTDAGPGWIGAPSIWDGSATSGMPGTMGEGIIVGVIDTGVDPFNPSFAATGDDGYTHTNPFGAGNYVGVCDPTNTNPPAGVVAYDPTFPCNSKLIGVWGYTASDPSPRDTDGHGSHTASTAAGNVVMGAQVTTPTGTYTADISGVAPHANVIVYDGCIDSGGCPGASLTAARDQLVLDGVDVVNYSIGSSAATGDPWSDLESQQWLAIRNAGIFVATSAGNAGPGDETIGSPGDLPWLTTVGASSHNRAFLNSVTLFDGTNFYHQFMPIVKKDGALSSRAAAPAAANGLPLTLHGQGMTGGYGPAKLVMAKDFVVAPTSEDDARLCAPGAFPPGTFNGEIVICERGVYGRVDKGQSAFDGGAGGFILAQPDEFGGGPGAIVADPHVLPGVHIDYHTYQALLDFVATSESDVYASIAGAELDVDDAHGDVMASFSSRGANRALPDVVVPSVTAPGRSIFAAYAQGAAGDNDPTFNVIGGTSMSSPHVAGAGALMKALYPDWTPAEIQSALMTTAVTDVINDDGMNAATPFAMGSGRIHLGYAAKAGLVLDVTTQEYVDANPETGGSPRDLNLASMGDAQCLGSCSWTRIVKSTEMAGTLDAQDIMWTASAVSPEGITITVSPESFTLAPGATQTLEITADVAASAPVNAWLFGHVVLTPANEDVAPAHLPVAVQPTNGNVPGHIDIDAFDNMGSQDITELETIEITALTVAEYGLVKGSSMSDSLTQDPTRSDPYDNLNDGTTFFVTTEVMTDSMRFVAEIVDSTATDIDLFIGADSNGDGMPQANEEACSSTTPTAIEYCNINSPEAGTWWILVQNWAESSDSPDSVTLSYATVPMMDAGNMTVTGPATNPAETPFDLTINWNEPTMVVGEYWYGGFTLGSDASAPDNLGTVTVDLERSGMPIISISPESLSSTQPQQSEQEQVLTISNIGNADLDWNVTSDAQGTEHVQDGSFEAGGSSPHWTTANTAGFNPICSSDSCTGGQANLSRTGDWWLWLGGSGAAMTASAMQDVVIPAGAAEMSFWLWMGVPEGGVGTMQVQVDGVTQMTITEADEATYNGYAQAKMDASAFADGNSHEIKFTMTKPSGANINFFVDDVSVQTFGEGESCKSVDAIPWLQVAPFAGTVAPSGSEGAGVIFSAIGVEQGVYSESLCVSSNDSSNPVVSVPVMMTVAGAADIMVDPASMSSTQAPDTTTMQTLTINNVGDADLHWDLGEQAEALRVPEDVLWEQTQSGTGGGVSDFFIEADGGAYTAADFNLTTAATIELLFAEGFVNSGSLADAESISWAIYTDAAGVPAGHPEDGGTAVWSYTSTPTGPGVDISNNNIGLDLNAAGQAFELDEGTYWLVVYPSIDTSVFPRWNWFQADNPAGTSTGQLIDPNDLFGAGATDWTSWTLLSDSITDFAFRVEGTLATCGADVLPWVSADTTSGTVSPAGNAEINVTFDSTGLEAGVYTGSFCIKSNDPDTPDLAVPLTLTVE